MKPGQELGQERMTPGQELGQERRKWGQERDRQLGLGQERKGWEWQQAHRTRRKELRRKLLWLGRNLWLCGLLWP